MICRISSSLEVGRLSGGGAIAADLTRRISSTYRAVALYETRERSERATRSERAGEAARESACRGVRGAKPLGSRKRGEAPRIRLEIRQACRCVAEAIELHAHAIHQRQVQAARLAVLVAL